MRISDWSSDVCSSDLREEYTPIKRRRDGRTEIVTHAAYTGAWSVAMDVGFAPSHRAKDAEAIAFAAYQVMAAQGITRLPKIEDSPQPIAPPVYEPLPPPPPAAPPPPRPGDQLAPPFCGFIMDQTRSEEHTSELQSL